MTNRIKDVPQNNGTVTVEVKKKPKRKKKEVIIVDLYFYRKDKSGSNFYVTGLPPTFTQDGSGRYRFESDKESFEYDFCKTGLTHFGLHEKDIPYGTVVHLEMVAGQVEKSVNTFKVESNGYKEAKLIGPNLEAIERAKRMKVRRDNDDYDDDDSYEEDT